MEVRLFVLLGCFLKFQSIAAMSCVDEERDCAHNDHRVCRLPHASIPTNKRITASDLPCQDFQNSDGSSCVYGRGRAPWCLVKDTNGQEENCYKSCKKDCYFNARNPKHPNYFLDNCYWPGKKCFPESWLVLHKFCEVKGYSKASHAKTKEVTVGHFDKKLGAEVLTKSWSFSNRSEKDECTERGDCFGFDVICCSNE